jgi:hypothetical protein
MVMLKCSKFESESFSHAETQTEVSVFHLPHVFRRAILSHLGGGSASKIDPLNLFLLDCLLLEAGGGDADCGDD